MTKRRISSFTGEFRFLSNFYPALVVYDGASYPTSEHAYQAAKALDNSVRLKVASVATPGGAKRLGRQLEMRPDWELVKVQVMLDILRIKFGNEDMRAMLLSTGDSELVEGNTWGDTFWGTHARSGQGQNMLGKLLMQVRGELRAMMRRPKRSEAKLQLVPASVEPERTGAVEFVPVPSARLITIDEHHTLWTAEPDETGATSKLVRGAIVRLVPPPEMTAVAVQQVARFLKDAGAAAVKVQPNHKRRVNPTTGDRSPVTVPTVRKVVGEMVEEAHCDGFERDELRDAVEAALTAEGI